MMVRPGAAAVLDWLVNAILSGQDMPVVIEGLAQRIVRTGLPVDRIQLGTTTIHPQHKSLAVTWHPDQPIEIERHPHGSWDEDAFALSPFSTVLGEAQEIIGGTRWDGDLAEVQLVHARRFDLLAADQQARYPVLGELAEKGFTDYLACAVPFWRDGGVGSPFKTGILMSWSTRAPGGFVPEDLTALTWLTPKLAVGVRNAMADEISRNILSTYLGNGAGARVLSGIVQQGDVETIEAAILIADLRGFTTLADTVPADRLIPALDDYLGCMADPVEAAGGEVLKFLGDGVLAVFPYALDDPEGRHRAHRGAGEAACTALRRVEALNRKRQKEGEPILDLDVALHTGPVQFGNVGAASRLDFTIIGPAVNEAARMEAMCAPLGVHVIASEAFVTAAGLGETYVPLGRHSLRGVAVSRHLFTAPDSSLRLVAAESA